MKRNTLALIASLVSLPLVVAGCAGGSTSEISPAKSSAQEEAFVVNGEWHKRTTNSARIAPIESEVADDTSEDK